VTDDLELVVERVATSRRYRHVDEGLLRRLAGEEVPRARTREEAVKRVKRRLHQAVGAFARGVPRIHALRDAWGGDLADPAFREACATAMRAHASTAERIPHLPSFYRSVWEITGTPTTLLDLGCGLGPLSLPWMGLGAEAGLVAVDVDGGALATVEAFLDLVGQPHRTLERDLCSASVDEPADVALLLKLVTTLDRQDPQAAARLVGTLRTAHAVVSFTRRSLGGRSRGMERTYRERLERLARDVNAREAREASVANELVFVLELARG
jgi:16S rRNA (guanine(1405)-N(7))-methyltransferase